MANLSGLSNEEIRAQLGKFGEVNPGPVTDMTRGVYLKKLERLMHPESGKKSPNRSSTSKLPSRVGRPSAAAAKPATPVQIAPPPSPPRPTRTASGGRKSSTGRTPPRGRKLHRSESEDAPSDEDLDNSSPMRRPIVAQGRRSPTPPTAKLQKSPVKPPGNRRSASSIIPGLSNLPTPTMPPSPVEIRPMQPSANTTTSSVTRRRSAVYSGPSMDFHPLPVSTRSSQQPYRPSLFSSSFDNLPSPTTRRATPRSSHNASGRLLSDLGHSSADEVEDRDDDDYEGYATSRVLFEFQTPQGGNRLGRVLANCSPSSAIHALNRYRKNAWDALARRFAERAQAASVHPTQDRYSLRSSTSNGRYGSDRYSPNLSRGVDDWRTTRGPAAKKTGMENISRVLLMVLVAFAIVLLIAYVASAHADAVRETGVYIKEAGGHVKGAAADTIKFFYSYAVLPVIIATLVAGFCFAAYFGHAYYTTMREKEMKERFELVDEILAIVQDASEDDDDPTVAIPHVRDRLIPASDRHGSRLSRWNWAVRYINENESRVSTESRLINGVECAVWRWLPPSGKSPVSRAGGWQGSALTPAQAAKSGPSQALSQCLKIRGMFNPSGPAPVDVLHIENALRMKLMPIRALHIAVDAMSRDGVAYAKLANKQDAERAYRMLHGEWLNGQLINVKYIPDARYAQRFPKAP